MSKILSLVIVLSLSCIVGVMLASDSGYVLMAYGSWSMELPLWLFILVLFVSYFLMLSTLKLLDAIKNYIFGVGSKYSRSKMEYLFKKLDDALEAIILNDSKLLSSSANKIKPLGTRLTSVIINAKKHIMQDDDKAFNEVLARGIVECKKREIPIQLFRVDSLITQGDLNTALKILKGLQAKYPKHDSVLARLLELYKVTNDWRNILCILPKVKRHKVLAKEDLYELEVEVNFKQLEYLISSNSLDVDKTWAYIDKKLRDDERLLEIYIKYLINHNSSDKALYLLKTRLKKQFSESLVKLYPLIAIENYAPEIKFLEELLKESNSPELKLALATLYCNDKLWGRAKQYLDNIVAQYKQPEAYLLLGKVLTELKEYDGARNAYKLGLESSVT